MQYECFDVEVSERIAHVRLSRPDKRNSMIASFWRELPALITELDDAGEIRVIVLSSSGPHFSSGMDVSVFAGNVTETDKLRKRQHAARFKDTVTRLQQSFSAIEQARIPVIAAVQGGCIGAGIDLVTACDMRYATQDAFFTIYETNLAMTADVGTFPRICKLMPDGIVRELAYTGRPLSASEAREYGLVNAVFDTQDAMIAAVLGIAKTIAGKAPLTIHGCKRMVLHSRDHSVAETLDYVALWNTGFFQREEIAEAMAAAAEKRPGEFASLPERRSDADGLLDMP